MNGGTCRDGTHNFTCSCPSPYYGQRCQGKSYFMLSNSGDGVEMTVTRDPGKRVKDEYFLAIRF